MGDSEYNNSTKSDKSSLTQQASRIPRSGLSVEDLKAMTARRLSQSGESSQASSSPSPQPSHQLADEGWSVPRTISADSYFVHQSQYPVHSNRVPQTQMNIYNQPQQWQYMQPMPMYVPYTSSYTSSPQALSPSSPVYYVSPPYVPTEQQFGSIYQPQQHHSLRSNHPMSVEDLKEMTRIRLEREAMERSGVTQVPSQPQMYLSTSPIPPGSQIYYVQQPYPHHVQYVQIPHQYHAAPGVNQNNSQSDDKRCETAKSDVHNNAS